jgi:aryl-alcohol dehydrogenase-like predicted oxidoreductase
LRFRPLGRTGIEVSEIGFGAWAIGGGWGRTDDDLAMAALHGALGTEVNFFDTADVYGGGHSELLLARLRSESKQSFYVATKAGRKAPALTAREFDAAHLRPLLAQSCQNLGVERLDLVQLHCPPYEVYYLPEVFEALDGLVQEGLIAHYGVSVERVEEALKAIEYPGVETVQIIFNVFRQRPADLFLAEAARRRVGVIVRVPLASGLLTGKLSSSSAFDADDHRSFNRHGESFDVGETFAGVPFEVGLEAVDRLRPLVPEGMSMTQFALRWILDYEAVSTVIAGARTYVQAGENASASDLAPLGWEAHEQVKAIYSELVAPYVHQRW